MELENKIKCVLMDFEINEITLQEATKRILLLLDVVGRSEQCDHDYSDGTGTGWNVCKNCEMCILGAKGNMLQHKKVNNIFQLMEAERTKHSKKPIEAIERIEMLFDDLPRVEPFYLSGATLKPKV